jgi:DNA gyrase subunit A
LANNEHPEPPQAPPPNSGAQLPLGGEGGKNLIPVNIEDEMRRSYLDYAMSVIIGRALPDVRDGLKPVHRRILYAMSESGLFYKQAHAPSAPKSWAKCSAMYHPHGDICGFTTALVRMGPPFLDALPLHRRSG